MKNKKLLKIFILSILIFVSSFNQKVYANASVSISAPGSVVVGNNVTISINNNNSDYTLSGKLTISGAASGAIDVGIFDASSQSRTVTASKTGNINIYFEGIAAPLVDPENYSNIRRSATVSVTNSSSGTYNPSLPKGESEAEKAARLEREAKEKLEERKRHPLFEEIIIISESQRLKGKKAVTKKTDVETFEYELTLPRNIDEFKLDLKPIADDVKLTYDKMYKLDKNHDKVEIMVKAVQDEVSQEFKITVNRHKDSEVSFKSGESNITLLNDNLIDKALKEFGIERKLFDKKKDDTFYYYEYNDKKFALTFDEENVARWVFLDDKGKLLDEFVLVIDQNDKPRFLVNVELEESPTLQGNRYELKEIELSKSITQLDESITFNNLINAWEFDEKGIITHEYVEVESKDLASTDEEMIDLEEASPYKLVYVGKDAVVESAFVAFDEINQNMMYLAISLFVLLVILLIVFIIYWRSTSKKMNQILSRRS